MQNVVITKTSDLAKRLFRGLIFINRNTLPVFQVAVGCLFTVLELRGTKRLITVGTESLIDEQ